MLFNVRSTSIRIAVISFFSLGFIGWTSGLSPFICCKRALLGAVLACISGIFVVRVINTIVLNAMVANQLNKKKEMEGARKNEK